MSDPDPDPQEPDNKDEQPKKKRLRRPKPRKIVNHELAARWIQEQILEQIPELGYVSDKLIERIIKLEHKYYIKKGYKQIKFTDRDDKK